MSNTISVIELKENIKRHFGHHRLIFSYLVVIMALWLNFKMSINSEMYPKVYRGERT